MVLRKPDVSHSSRPACAMLNLWIEGERDMKHSQRILAAFLAICMAAVLFSGCGSVDTFMDTLMSGDSVSANDLFMEKIADNPKQVQKLREEYRAEQDRIYSDLNSGKITAEDARVQTESLAGFLLSADFDKRFGEIWDLIFSKEAFAAAEDCMSTGDELTAIGCYAKVIAEDTNYDTAQSRRAEAYSTFISRTLDEAQSHALTGDYAAAAETLGDALERIANTGISYNGELDEKYAEFCEAQTAAEVEELLRKADDLVNDGDYTGAFALFRTGLDQWPAKSEIADAYAEAQHAYANTVLDEAAERFTSNQDYAGAMAILEVAGSEVASESVSALLTRAYDYYAAFAPAGLGDLETFYDDDATIWWVHRGDDHAAQYITDTLGATYDCVYWMNESSDTYAVYQVSNYDHFSCRIIIPTYCKDYNNCGKLELYLDGNLAYESPMMGKGSYPIDVSLDLNGAVELKVCYTNLTKERENFYGTGHFFLANPYLSKSTDGAEPFAERA